MSFQPCEIFRMQPANEKTMKISKKRVLALFIVPVAAIVLSGCGAKDKTSTPVPAPTPAPQQSMPAPAVESENGIPSLPADNKQAIEAEIQGIDQALQEAESSLSADAQDDELGF
ncbi:MAG: hypothetical protein ACD_9C00281G0004 [uncultured bacterium]|nr:MAG: hypothetical protein ACD_9C00281G0004 [uncultured bacterium]